MGALTFGPVPSRRLGRSLGINHLPSKVCSYACVYCQVGRTTALEIERRSFVAPETLAAEVRSRVDEVRGAGERIDYLTFVPDGEPTLDANLGRHIEHLRDLAIPIAVLTNASLLWRPDVREDLSRADWVSVKVDAVDEGVWRKINRPHGLLRLDAILDGILRFAEAFEGTLVTETMLVAGVNDGPESLERVAEFLGRLGPRKAYLSVPTRPPSETWVGPPGEATIAETYRILSRTCRDVETLTEFEGTAFSTTEALADDILATAAVHPIREDAMRAILERSGSDESVVQSLVVEGRLEEITYEGRRYYRQKASASSDRSPRAEVA